jgi:hypothetical protein
MGCPFGFLISKNRVNTLALLKPCINFPCDFWDVHAFFRLKNYQRHLGSFTHMGWFKLNRPFFDVLLNPDYAYIGLGCTYPE